MMGRVRLDREGALGLVLALVLAGGVAFDLTTKTVELRRPSAPSGERFAARSVFCPPSQGAVAKIAIGGDPGEAVPVGIESGEQPQRRELKADALITLPAPSQGGMDVVGYGAPVFASATLDFSTPIPGAGAALCSPAASQTWYFADGRTTLDHDDRFVLYNPFPDEAVVRIVFHTSAGARAKAGLSDVAVPAGEFRVIAANEYILRHAVIGATISAQRGRVVAWRAQFSNPENRPRGDVYTLGATAPALTWYFPDGGAAEGVEERIAIANPGEDEAVVSVSLMAADRAIQPPELVELPIPAGSSQAVELPELLQGRDARVGGLSAVVRSTNGVPVVAERSMWYSGELSGATAELGATRPAQSWALGPALFEADADLVAVMNVGDQQVSFSITLVRAGGAPLEPAELQDIELGPGGRVKLPIGRWTSGRPMLALLRASGAVVAERFAYSARLRDAAALMGSPLTPSGR
jgi:hypothetical protein